ncbi:MAG: phosphoglycerate mutase family protein [Chloroflexota bacterium]|nr:phosphoglycerate mutase family protein [Chloroflexota bacterium]
MRTLDVRRHAMRRKPGQHLSQSGIELARLVGDRSGPYEWVTTSPLPRAVETAVAMGFEVNETVEDLARMPPRTLDGWPLPFAAVYELVGAGGQAAEFAARTLGVWREIVGKIPESGKALIVTHGGIVELGAVAAVPGGPQMAWGGPIGYLEGVRLTFEGDMCQCRVLRLPEDQRQIKN